jgi:hypothetical protein
MTTASHTDTKTRDLRHFNFISGNAAFHAKFSERGARFRERLEELRQEHALLRKPCPTCGNLVKPELQGQHDDAYHAPRN